MERLMHVLLFSAVTLGLDPCDNYTVLDNAWRSTSNRILSTVPCDRNVEWVGWYRLFLNNQSAQMPDTCVPSYSCGTDATLWLNGQHPRMEDGVVTRDVCGSWNSNCCTFKSTPINVKACPGQYYIYEFKIPTACRFAYCADVDECQANPSVCGPHSVCTNLIGGYNCSCLEGISATFPNLLIGNNNECMAPKKQIVRLGLTSGKNLNDPAVMRNILQAEAVIPLNQLDINNQFLKLKIGDNQHKKASTKANIYHNNGVFVGTKLTNLPFLTWIQWLLAILLHS